MEGIPRSDSKEAIRYEWGSLFASPWEKVVEGMAARARAEGLEQAVEGRSLTWASKDHPVVRYVFVDDPSDFDAVRRVFLDQSNARVPTCFLIVRQPDETETRGEIVFDIFRMNAKSYLWHFNRVYTPPHGART